MTEHHNVSYQPPADLPKGRGWQNDRGTWLHLRHCKHHGTVAHFVASRQCCLCTRDKIPSRLERHHRQVARLKSRLGIPANAPTPSRAPIERIAVPTQGAPARHLAEGVTLPFAAAE